MVDGKAVGVCGATGAVGLETIALLSSRNFPISKIVLFASSRSAGKTISTGFGELTLEEFSLEKAKDLDYVFLAVSGDFSLQYARDLAAIPNGPIVIDNSSAFRYDAATPLVVPEINGSVLLDEETGKPSESKRLIANPNCTTAIAVMALWPLHCEFGLKRVIVSTYQSASGGGQKAMDELREGAKANLEGRPVEHKWFAHPLPFNLIPQIDKFQPNGYTKEEMKVTWETQKIFDEPSLAVTCTAVRVPIMRAHSEAITLETELPVDVDRVRSILKEADGVDLVDDPDKLQYPMPLTATEKNNVEVGRIRPNPSFGKYGLDLFVAGDQLLRGAALNTVLIAEFLENPRATSQYKKKTTWLKREHKEKLALVAGISAAFGLAFAVARKN